MRSRGIKLNISFFGDKKENLSVICYYILPVCGEKKMYYDVINVYHRKYAKLKFLELSRPSPTFVYVNYVIITFMFYILRSKLESDFIQIC